MGRALFRVPHVRLRYPVARLYARRRIVLPLVWIVGTLIGLYLLAAIVSRVVGGFQAEDAQCERVRFWTTQGRALAALCLITAGLIAIWFDDPKRLASVAGLVGAGVAVALQHVITAFAGYLVLLRGKVFTVGDRITIGGVVFVALLNHWQVHAES